MAERRVAIVGGGIGGLTLAALLRGRGLEVDGVEIAPAWASGSVDWVTRTPPLA